ncbi:MAG: putative toxin-antitoxin system toxin component, PIN family [Gemmatimonadetes bacterium]|nr:putative toxin-antitoxin system toxin component, PIN family [Gemmatimonadota bacterium]
MSTDRVPRLVLDTNLFVGWIFRPQAPAPARILRDWSAGRLRVCTSPAVLREVRATLGRLPATALRRDVIFELLENPDVTEVLEEVADSGWRCADPEDDKFLHLALAAEADALLTSDRALLAVHDFPVPVLKSGQWLRESRRRTE